MKRVSDARSQRVDDFRQGREKQQVLLQLHNEQLKADAEAEALAAAAAAGGGDTEEKRAPRAKAEEERNLVIIIKADVQVGPHGLLLCCRLVCLFEAHSSPVCPCNSLFAATLH